MVYENIPSSEALSCLPSKDDAVYRLLEAPAEGWFLVLDANGAISPRAFIEKATGHVFSCASDIDVATWIDTPNKGEPLVKIVGDIQGDTGQITIRQPEGHYRRYSRWDRLSDTSKYHPSAQFRTLPQCGCGGYLGAPMLFDSFAEMSAYFYVAFCRSCEGDVEG